MTKDFMLRVRFDDEDRRRLDILADHYELSAGAVVRMLVKREAERLQRDPDGQLQRDAERLVEMIERARANPNPEPLILGSGSITLKRSKRAKSARK